MKQLSTENKLDLPMSHDGLQLSIGWKVRGNYKRKFLSDVGEHSVV